MIKRADKGSCVVIWDRNDYVKEAEIQLSNQNVYKNVNTYRTYRKKQSFFKIFKSKR